MARQSQPWFRTDRKTWCVTLDGMFHNLGPDRRAAMARFRELQRSPRQRHPVASATSLAGIADEFLDWCARNRSAATFEWYRLRLVVYLSPYAVEVSRRLAEEHPNGPLFRNSAGKAWNKDSVGCVFDRL